MKTYFRASKTLRQKKLKFVLYLPACSIQSLTKLQGIINWSYLSTARNNISLVQNAAIMLHEKAEFIFKMDEDIFITQNCLVKLLQTFDYVLREGRYRVGFVAPLIPINGFGHIVILEKLGLLDFYDKKFETAMYGCNSSAMLEKSPEVAKFFWGEGNIFPSIDQINAAFQIQKLSYRVCPMRFSIGLILFHRRIWELMGGWRVSPAGFDLGTDEAQICTFCVQNSFGMIISENALVGHLSFGQQNAAMKEYYLHDRQKFSLPE